MKSKPEVSDDEIRAFMDFDHLLKQREMAITRKDHVMKIVTGLTVMAVVVVLSLVWWNERQSEKGSQRNSTLNEETSDTPGIIDSVGQETVIKNDDEPIVKIERPSVPKDEKTNRDDVKEHENEETVKNKNPLTIQPEESEPGHDYVYKEAEPVDGYPALYTYFNRELVYPQEALRDSVQGVVTVSFIIGVSGRPENIQIQESMGEPFDRETRRIIENMPLWNAATVNGKPVSSKLSLPLTFQIQKIKRKE